jgi:hypothetical protein
MKNPIVSMTLVAAALWLAGCQDRFTTQEAYATCEELQERNAFADSSETFADCVDCHETCGADCAVQPTSPATFACPDELADPEEEGEGGGDAEE